MFDYQSIAYYIHVLNHKLNTYSNWRIKIWTLHTLNKSNIKVHESFKKICILIGQMLLFSARTKTKQSKVGTIKNPANLEKKASTQWAVSSPLADLSFHIPVLFYNDSSSSVIISHQLARLFEKELELNSLDWNVNELEHKHQLEDMKPTHLISVQQKRWV